MKKYKATLRTRNLKPVDQAYFICEHLEGEANDEIRVSNMCTDQEQRGNIQIRFSLFLKSCMVALNPISNKAFSRGSSGREEESLQEFSHALCCLMKKRLNGVSLGEHVLVFSETSSLSMCMTQIL